MESNEPGHEDVAALLLAWGTSRSDNSCGWLSIKKRRVASFIGEIRPTQISIFSKSKISAPLAAGIGHG